MQTITQLAENVYGIDESLQMMPGVRLPIRATVLRDSDGTLTIISPVQGVDRWGPEVSQLGAVTRIIAPNTYHHLFVLPAVAQFPQADLLASAALRNKRKDFPAKTQWLEGPGPIDITPDLQAHLVAGMTSQEWVLLHKPSRTLVVTDLIFHVLEPGFGLGLVNRMVGTYKTLAVSKLFLRDRKDKTAYAASLQTIGALPFDKLVMAHGEPLLADAQARVQATFAKSP